MRAIDAGGHVQEPIEALDRRADLRESVKPKILHGNAQRCFGLEER